MNFREKKGDGGHSNPKKIVADFSTSEKRGGQRPFGSFPKIHPNLRVQASLTKSNIGHAAMLSRFSFRFSCQKIPPEIWIQV